MVSFTYCLYRPGHFAMASPAAGTEWTAVLTLPKFTKNTTHDKKAQTARHGTERGCEVGLNASGEKYMDLCCQI